MTEVGDSFTGTETIFGTRDIPFKKLEGWVGEKWLDVADESIAQIVHNTDFARTVMQKVFNDIGSDKARATGYENGNLAEVAGVI